MKRYLLLPIVLLSVQSVAQKQQLIIGTYTNNGKSEGIYLYNFDVKTGDAKQIGAQVKKRFERIRGLIRHAGALIEFKRCDQEKLGNAYIEHFAVNHTFHFITALHAAHIGFKITARNVFVHIARLNNGLFANHTFAVYFAARTVRIKDIPMTAHQLYGILAKVLNIYPVSKHKMLVSRVGVLGLIDGFYRNFYAIGDFCYHRAEISINLLIFFRNAKLNQMHFCFVFYFVQYIQYLILVFR